MTMDTKALNLQAGLLMATKLLEDGWGTEEVPGFLKRGDSTGFPVALETWYALRALQAGMAMAEAKMKLRA